MSIQFSFTAQVNQREAVHEALEQLGKQFGYRVYPDAQLVRVNLCRMGDLFFTFEKDTLCCECTTSLVGAGFHAAAIDFVDALTAKCSLQIKMEDETDYYTCRDFDRMREDHFYKWLNTLITVSKHQLQKGETKDFCICWSLDQYLPKSIDGTVVTPFGRYDIGHLMQHVEAKGIASFAERFFLWNERERNARFYRNSALALLWEDCYFIPGARSDEDEQINGEAIKLLEKAAALDRTLPFPKEAYVLLCELNAHESIDISGLPDDETDFPVGYRRDIVRWKIGNFHIPVHGSFLFSYDDENGRGDYVWYDGRGEDWHSLRVTAFTCRDGDATFSERLFEDMAMPPEEFAIGEGRCRAGMAGKIEEEDQSVYYQAIAQAICGRETLLITASFEKKEELDWAMALFRGMTAASNKNKK